MSYSINDKGELVEVVEQVVNEAEVEQQLQAALDEAQNEVNTHQANVTNAEEELAAIEAQADAKNAEWESHQASLEAAQAKLSKSESDHASLVAARQLRAELPGAESEGEADSDASEPAESETVEVPVNVITAEG